MQLVTRLDRWFAERLEGLKCREDTLAYVTGVLAGFKARDDMSRESVVLAFHEARLNGDFVAFQRIGDWALWIGTFHPRDEHHEVVESLGRLSYYSCHRIMRGEWRLYEELADELPIIAQGVRCKLELARCSMRT